MNKKVYCKECNLIYDEKEVEKLHKLSNFEKHTYVKDNLPFEAVVHLCNRVKELEKKIEENYKVESELLYMIQENRLLINLFRSESQISIIHPEYELLNCKSTRDNEKSSCLMFRSKNIIYLTLVFNGKIDEVTGTNEAQIVLKMPMWFIYSGSFIVESLYNCLSQSEKIIRLCAKYEQDGNEITISINQSDLDIQTYWIKSEKYSNFTIKGNFMIQPPSRRRLGKFYLCALSSNKVVLEKDNGLFLTKNWKEGSLLEIYQENPKDSFEKIKINGKYLCFNKGLLKLEKDKKKESEIELRYIPGYSDIIQIIFIIEKQVMFLEENGDNITLVEREKVTNKSQFLIIPELPKINK